MSSTIVPYQPEVRSLVWWPLPSGWVSLMTDAAFYSDTHQGGMGYIIRDSQGAIKSAISQSASFLSTSVGEAVTIRSTLVDALQQGYCAIQVESDCLGVVNLLNGVSNEGDPYLLAIVRDILYLKTQMDNVVFMFIPRKANVIAHSLTRRVTIVPRKVVWPLSSPWLEQLGNFDATAMLGSINE
ncbi:hypothetical protein NE237_029536 [Protea cynaroides]|uniref:RNase H type-1 domain-containing protein n=1 Tax=Protea cynaroides TaxID=273540 RepID=A0A9Q0GVZ7_9MAGN|nr:hypothetical protein NE237_029536 [Protea cynaroides]